MLCSSKLTYLGRPGPIVLLTTINESCNTAPLMSRWQMIMQPSLRGLWKTVSCPCQATRRGLQMTGFEMFSGRRSRATAREITALLRINSRKQAIWMHTAAKYRSHGLVRTLFALIWKCRHSLSLRTPFSFRLSTQNEIYHVRYFDNVHLAPLFAGDSKENRQSTRSLSFSFAIAPSG